MRRLVRQIDEIVVDKAPSPTLRRVVAFNDGVSRRVEVLRGMLACGVITAANVPTFPAEPQMNPSLTDFQAFLAPQATGGYPFDRRHMRALGH